MYPHRLWSSTNNHKADPKINSNKIIFVIINKRSYSLNWTTLLAKWAEQSAENQKKTKKSAKETWFNPTYSKPWNQILANVFMFNKHFPPEHTFHKTFNRNLSKLSHYYCSKYLKNLQLFKGKALTNKYLKNLRLFKGKALPNKLFIS